jgi:hypothetical protein
MEVIKDANTVADAGFDKFLTREDPSSMEIPGSGRDQVLASSILSGKLGKDVVIELGNGRMQIDGKHDRLLVNDGTRDRFVLGKLDDDTYGLTFSDDSGQTTFDASRFVVSDGTDDRIQIGKRDDGTFGIDVSKAGEDVNTPGTDGVNLVLSSNYNIFKIISLDTGSFSVASGTAVVSSTVTHNLGYKPTILASYYRSSATTTRIPMPHTLFYTGGGALDGHVAYTVQITNVSTTQYTITIAREDNQKSVATYTLFYQCYLLRETLI